jgi:hypothetical protein
MLNLDLRVLLFVLQVHLEGHLILNGLASHHHVQFTVETTVNFTDVFACGFHGSSGFVLAAGYDVCPEFNLVEVKHVLVDGQSHEVCHQRNFLSGSNLRWDILCWEILLAWTSLGCLRFPDMVVFASVSKFAASSFPERIASSIRCSSLRLLTASASSSLSSESSSSFHYYNFKLIILYDVLLK